eukprot:TRINITY_DN30531_c0_g1_i1.p1 TRINITY_DN30531_c0_g1~~TRINITY_DN30531_c0_g1_i1.p1  ORF type:complete len:285 (-),score=63.00 TRINITY_DN30531_c0_g1_i1:267-1121(-)
MDTNTLAIAVTPLIIILSIALFRAMIPRPSQDRRDASCTAPKSRQRSLLPGESPPAHIQLEHTRLPDDVMLRRCSDFSRLMNQRRSVRFFDAEVTPSVEVLRECIQCAGTAPSGAHCQPWRFVLVQNREAKVAIRTAVEAEEQQNYDRRMRRSWVEDCNPLVSDLHHGDLIQKPYLTEAPWLLVVMKLPHEVDEDGERVDHYYVEQSVGIAVGLFLAALTNAGLVTLTSTPMGAEKAIRKICGRPDREKVYLLMPIGFPAKNATVPFRNQTTLRKPLDQIMAHV